MWTISIVVVGIGIGQAMGLQIVAKADAGMLLLLFLIFLLRGLKWEINQNWKHLDKHIYFTSSSSG